VKVVGVGAADRVYGDAIVAVHDPFQKVGIVAKLVGVLRIDLEPPSHGLAEGIEGIECPIVCLAERLDVIRVQPAHAGDIGALAQRLVDRLERRSFAGLRVDEATCRGVDDDLRDPVEFAESLTGFLCLIGRASALDAFDLEEPDRVRGHLPLLLLVDLSFEAHGDRRDEGGCHCHLHHLAIGPSVAFRVIIGPRVTARTKLRILPKIASHGSIGCFRRRLPLPRRYPLLGEGEAEIHDHEAKGTRRCSRSSASRAAVRFPVVRGTARWASLRPAARA